MRTVFFFQILVLLILVVSILDIHPELAQALVSTSGPVQAKTPKDCSDIIATSTEKIESLKSDELKSLGICYSKQNNAHLAIKTFSHGLTKNPSDNEFRVLTAAEQIKMHKDREAMSTLKEALELDPKYERAYLEIEKIYIKRNNKYELRVLYTDMLEKIGPKPEYYTRLCELHTQSGIYDLAKQYCRKGIDLVKDSEPKNYVYLAVALRDSGNLEEAKVLFKKAAETFKKSDEAQIGYAQYLEDQKNYAEAIKFYKNATEANPKLTKAWVGYAMMAFELQKYQDSIDAMTEACKTGSSASTYVRRIMGQLMIQKLNVWYAKFDSLSERCHTLLNNTSN